ncbi:MAG: ThuA domain-containing protein [Kiritimatiellales bacterium]|nr:ThuA domain-containing protein [Kiritimatiellales bacterium]
MKKMMISAVLAITVIGLSALDSEAAKKQKKPKGPKPPPPPTSAEEMANIKAALPTASVKPSRPRKILIFTLCQGFVHKSIPVCTDAFKVMGEKTGAFTADSTADKTAFTAENLAQYDAVLFNNTTRIQFTDAQKKALLDFVHSGKGVIGIHAATDNFYEWPEGAAMMGGLFSGHPWTAGGLWAFKLDEPNHPLNKSYGGKGFKVKDEIYQFKEPYSRDNQRVLVSLDMADANTKDVKGGKIEMMKRTDGDFAVVWLKREGKGRVFFSGFGHNREIFWNPAIMQQYLDGIQYALGDYKLDDKPVK